MVEKAVLATLTTKREFFSGNTSSINPGGRDKSRSGSHLKASFNSGTPTAHKDVICLAQYGVAH